MNTRKLYVGLTRKPQMMGMSYEVFVSLMLFVVLLFLVSRILWAPLLAVPAIYLGRFVYKYDQHLIDIYLKKYSYCPPVRNKVFWNYSNSYDVAYPTKKYRNSKEKIKHIKERDNG